MLKKNALVISDYDSRISWCNGFAIRLKSLEFKVTFVALMSKDDLSKREVSKNIDSIVYLNSFKELDKVFLNTYSLIVLMVGGGMYLKVYDIFRYSYQNSSIRPVIISGFNGVEDISEPQGILVRSISDYICINSLSFFKYVKTLFTCYGLESHIVRTGFVRAYWDKLHYEKPIHIKKVMFVLQPGVLDHPKQLKYIGEKLKVYRELYPTREIVIKARGRKNVPHVNSSVQKDLYMEFWDELVSELGKKVTISYDEVETLLNDMDVVISYTSAVLIESIILNKHVIALSDYGVSKKIGNAFLMKSNLLTPFDKLFKDEYPSVDDNWEKDWCLYDSSNIDTLIEESYQLYEKQLLDGKLPFIDGFFNENQHPYLFLFRNRFDNTTPRKISFVTKVRKSINKVLIHLFRANYR